MAGAETEPAARTASVWRRVIIGPSPYIVEGSLDLANVCAEGRQAVRLHRLSAYRHRSFIDTAHMPPPSHGGGGPKGRPIPPPSPLPAPRLQSHASSPPPGGGGGGPEGRGGKSLSRSARPFPV